MKLELHRCKICGTRWLLWPEGTMGPSARFAGGGWNLLDKYSKPGQCCDNAPMGEQIEHLRDIPLTSPASDALTNELVTEQQRAVAADAALLRLREQMTELQTELQDFLRIVATDGANLVYRKRVALELFDKVAALAAPPIDQAGVVPSPQEPSK